MEKNLSKFNHNITKAITEVPDKKINKLWEMIESSVCRGSRIFLLGNGGSHAICNHIATDFEKRLNHPAHSLSNPGLITCYANDYGFDQMYVEWLDRFGLIPTDLVIGVSSSGSSPDILNALEFAFIKGSLTSLIHGFDERPIAAYDLTIYLDSQNYGVVELSTEIILHYIVERLVEKNGQR